MERGGGGEDGGKVRLGSFIRSSEDVMEKVSITAAQVNASEHHHLSPVLRTVVCT